MKRMAQWIVGLLVVLVPATGWAQATGNLYGTVLDQSGAAMPGVSVNLTGSTIGGMTTVTGAKGDFHFLNLDPSTYKLEVSLAGFTTILREAIINSGQNVELSFSLKVATQAETVTVTAETPVVDTKRVGTQTTLTKEELADIPNSRDPWSLLRTIPGVVVDRVNIAGNESGQQSNFQGKGSMVNDSTFSMDGVVITDMAAIGGSPTYFDYDAFDEVNFSTGGNDIKVATGGIGINFVTKRGTNNFHGNVHGYIADHNLESTNLAGSGVSATDARLALPGGGFADTSTHIDEIGDYGGDLGGPLVKDKLWFWGSYGRQDIRNVNFNQTTDKTVLEDYSGKLNWQATPSDMVSVFYFNGQKLKYGRNIGPVSNNPQSFLADQANAYPGGPHGLVKGEWDHVFSPSLTIALKYAYYGTGFGFTPIGGAGQSGGLNFVTNSSVGSFVTFSSLRPEHIANLDGNYFFTGLGGSNELKFGFAYRRTPVTSTSTFSGNQILGLVFGADAAGTPNGIAQITRPLNRTVLSQYSSGYVGDTLTSGRLTVNAGVRYDHQTGANEASSAPANPAFPNLLPTLNYPGGGQAIDFNNVSPRVAITYALDDARKTVVRGSYSHYAGQLANVDQAFVNPLGSAAVLAYNWTDLNHDGLVQPNEINFAQGLQYSAFVNPSNPGSATTVNQLANNYAANQGNEVIVGFDRELMPDFALNVAYTYRHETDLVEWQARLGMTSADYTIGTPVSANGYTAVAYSPNQSLVNATNGGAILENRPDYHTNYNGAELSFVKRLSHKWMTRVALSYMNWAQYYDGPNAIQNPTRTDVSYIPIGAVFSTAGPSVQGGQVVPRSAGSGKGDIFFSPKWQVSANALYQLPWAMEVSGSLFGRQGYPEPIVFNANAGGDGTLRALATPDVDTIRYANVWDLDLRFAKNFRFGETGRAAVIVDCFNVFNSNPVLNVTRVASSPVFGQINELLSPRIFRIGVRLGF